VRIHKLDHVQLAMPPGEEARATAFYEGVLGIPRVPKPPRLAERGGCWFEDAGVKVHLGADPGFRPAQKAHPALVVDDLPALVAVLEAAGHPVRHDGAHGGYARAYVDDPFGNRIELMGAIPGG
jgi:catechol 2,3-dioxygenase-like lactoylglutathione lyase family enzyme